jgi:hypothetical protein
MHIAAKQLRSGVVPDIADLFKLLTDRKCQSVLSSCKMKRPLAHEYRHEILRPIKLLSQCTSPEEGLIRIRRRITFRRSECRSKGGLQVQLLLLPLRTVWQTSQRIQPLAQLGDRLGHRRTGQRLLTGLQAISDRLLDQFGFRAMPGQKRGLRQHDVRKAILESGGNSGV